MALSELCEDCGKRRKRYRSAFSSWICDNCKKETTDYNHPEAFMRTQVNDWINSLPYEKQLEMYLKDKQKEDSLNISNTKNV